MGNHVGTNVNYTYINGSNTGNLSNLKQAATISIPVTATEGINPTKKSLSKNGANILMDYLSIRNTHTAVKGYGEYKMSDYFTYDTGLGLDVDYSRGKFNMGSNILSDMIGTTAINTKMQDLINKGVTRVSHVADATLGDGRVREVLKKGIEMKNTVPLLFGSMYDGKVDKKKSVTNSLGLVGSSGTLYGGNNVLPSTRNLRRTNAFRRAPMLRVLNCKSGKSEFIVQCQEVVQNTQDAITLDTHTDNQGDKVYTCPAAALNTGEHQVEISAMIDGMVSTIEASYAAEQHTVMSQVIAASMTGSTPGIAIPPGTGLNAKVKAITKECTEEGLADLAETFRIAGTLYDISIGSDSIPAAPVVSVDILQDLVDSTSLPTSEGARVGPTERLKRELRAAFPTDNYLTEALIADPKEIDMMDLNTGQYFETSWLDVILATPNAYSTGNSEKDSQLNNEYMYGDVYFKSIDAMSAKPASLNSQPVVYNMVTKKDCYVAVPFGSSFKVLSAFSDYDITFSFDLAWSATSNTLTNTITDLEVGVFIADAGQNHTNGAFIPVKAIGSMGGQGSISLGYDSLLEIPFLNYAGTLGTGRFSFGAICENKGSLSMLSNVSIKVASGIAKLTRRVTSQKVNSWIVGGLQSPVPLVDHFFSIFANDIETVHPFDVSKFWHQNVIALFNPYISVICTLLMDARYVGVILGLWYDIREYLPPSLEVGREFEKWLIQMIQDMPNWMLWRGNAPATLITPSSKCPFVMFAIFKSVRAMVNITPYERQNLTTIASAMKNINSDAISVTSDLALLNKRQLLDHYSGAYRNADVSVHLLNNGLFM